MPAIGQFRPDPGTLLTRNMEQCNIQRPKQWIVTVQITCRAGESLESASWRWRPIMDDRLVIQAAGDEGIVLQVVKRAGVSAPRAV